MALLQRAHERAYRFPLGFVGFTATAHTADQAATLEVKGKRDFELSSVDGAADGWTRERIASILGHRWALRGAVHHRHLERL
jgi:hypothetical protein